MGVLSARADLVWRGLLVPPHGRGQVALAGEPAEISDLGDWSIDLDQQPLGRRQSQQQQVLMRRLSQGLGERLHEVPWLQLAQARQIGHRQLAPDIRLQKVVHPFSLGGQAAPRRALRPDLSLRHRGDLKAKDHPAGLRQRGRLSLRIVNRS